MFSNPQSDGRRPDYKTIDELVDNDFYFIMVPDFKKLLNDPRIVARYLSISCTKDNTTQIRTLKNPEIGSS